MTTQVLLIHGLWNRHFWLWPLASRLRQGFEAHIFTYDSVTLGPDRALTALTEIIERLGGPCTSWGTLSALSWPLKLSA
jgi:hypothetical protein